MQLDIEDRAYGFEIQRDGKLFRLVDRDTSNNWGELSARWSTRDEAEEYARQCDAFKRGLRGSLQ